MAIAGWIIVAMTALALVTQVGSWNVRPIIALHCFVPFLAPLNASVVVVTAFTGPLALLLASLGCCVATAFAVAPARRARRTPTPTTGTELRVLMANLLFENPDSDGTTARAIDAISSVSDVDVLVLIEFTDDHRRTFVHAFGDRYPHRLEHSASNAGGIAMWSRFPLIEPRFSDHDGRESVVACVGHGSAQFRVIGVHPFAPTTRDRVKHWAPGIADAGVEGSRPGPPTVIVGDFNATRWHPPFRRLLQNGWTDAHEACGKGRTVSWPINGIKKVPAFMRLDHALVDVRLKVADVRDFDTPGSDHRGFVVTVVH